MVTLDGFISFIQNEMQIPASALPTSSPSILMALALSEAIVNPALCVIGPGQGNSLGYTGSTIYDLAVYNLAADNLINFANDQSFSITGITWTTNVATVTTSVAHGFNTGDPILVSGVAPLAYNNGTAINGIVTGTPIVVTGATTFTYALVGNPGSYSAGGIASEIYFTAARKAYNINGFVAGVIASSADVSTSESLEVPEQLKTLTLQNLQNLKTPWGRWYTAIAGQYGTLWGMN
jgi:hypothetical protein